MVLWGRRCLRILLFFFLGGPPVCVDVPSPSFPPGELKKMIGGSPESRPRCSPFFLLFFFCVRSVKLIEVLYIAFFFPSHQTELGLERYQPEKGIFSPR